MASAEVTHRKDVLHMNVPIPVGVDVALCFVYELPRRRRSRVFGNVSLPPRRPHKEQEELRNPQAAGGTISRPLLAELPTERFEDRAYALRSSSVTFKIDALLAPSSRDQPGPRACEVVIPLRRGEVCVRYVEDKQQLQLAARTEGCVRDSCREDVNVSGAYIITRPVGHLSALSVEYVHELVKMMSMDTLVVVAFGPDWYRDADRKAIHHHRLSDNCESSQYNFRQLFREVSATIPPEEPMKKRNVVFAGCGGITGAWMNAVKAFPDVKIVGLCDLSASSIDAFSERWKVSPVSAGDDLERVIRESGADTVFDCTVPSAHHAVTKTSLAAGCDVLGEKPMASSLDEAVDMVTAARNAGKTYAVIQNRRYLPGIRRFRQAIGEAAIGALTTLDVDFYIGAHFGGFRADMNHVLLLDMAIHTFDQARFLSGADAEYVYAADWNPAGSWYRHGASAVAFFEMSGGVRCTYRGSWCAGGCNTSWEGQWRATGTTGTLLWDGDSVLSGERDAGGTALIHDFAAVDVPPEAPIEHTGHAGVIRDFLDSLHAGRTPGTDCTDNVKSVAMVLAAVESAEAGKRVKVWREAHT